MSRPAAAQPSVDRLRKDTPTRDSGPAPLQPAWVAEILDRCQTRYIGADGVLVTALDAGGTVIDAAPLVADFGDVLPFLWHFGSEDFARNQLQRAGQYLHRGLFKWNDRVQLFLNHDWLLGLLDLYRQSADASFLRMAEAGATTLSEYFRGDVLFDGTRPGHWRGWLKPASPFNGGYVELWVDLFKYTGNPLYLEWAQRLAGGWSRTDSFERLGIFSRIQSTRSAAVAALLERLSSLKARLFKDNTNLVWGILALHRSTSDPRWQDVLDRWLRGFQAHFWNHGNVYLMLDPRLRGYEPSLKAGFSSLDLLCDLHHAGIQPERTLELAVSIADFWLAQQWDSGLFPEIPAGQTDHLDANVDLTLALWKLHAITGQTKYYESASRCRATLLSAHRTPYGYCLSVDESRHVVDPRIIVKYQGLLLKLALLPQDSGEMFANENLRELLRDR